MRLFLFLLLSSISVANAQLCDPNTNSLRFDGNSYVRFPSNPALDITDEITVEAWIKATTWAQYFVQGSIVCKHGWNSGVKGYVLCAGGNGVLSFAIAGIDQHGCAVGWKEIWSAPNSLQLNTWHHVAGTYDGNKLRLFIDGDQVASINFKGSIVSSSPYDLKIGRMSDELVIDKRFFTGYIDEVRIWDEALSRTTIEDNMNEHISPNSSDLVAYWRLNDGSGLTASDLGGAGCNGTLDGTHWDVDVPFTNGILRPVITSAGNDLISSALTGNQWNLNGVMIPGATGISYTPTSGGQYTVTANYGFGCTATSDVFDVVFTAVEEIADDFKLLHPSAGIYRIQTGRHVSRAHIQITDLTGRVVFSDHNLASVIDLRSQSKGLYILMLTIDDEKIVKKFFVD